VFFGVGQAKALTTSVDHSAMCLDVAMANFRLNGIPLAFSADKSKSRGTSLSSMQQPTTASILGFPMQPTRPLLRNFHQRTKKGWQGGRKRGEGHEFVARDAFQELIALRAKSRKFDVVLLDPPALARTSALSGTPPTTCLLSPHAQAPSL
jgi:hypothetical protein